MDGSIPDTNSTRYMGEIYLTENTEIKAIAIKNNMLNSNVVTMVYAINLPPVVAMPNILPSVETITSPTTIVITTATDAATIYYTTNGAVPIQGISSQYTAPFNLTTTYEKNITIRAIAVKQGMDNSLVATREYTLLPNTGAPNPPLNLTISRVGSTFIEFAWVASVGATSYKIYMNHNFATTTTQTTFMKQGLLPNTEYTFAVSSVGVNGESSLSLSVTTKTGQL
jgi:hypothetical protein